MKGLRRLIAHCLFFFVLVAAFSSRLAAQAPKYEGLPVRNIAFDPVEQPLEASELHDILPLQMNQPLQADVVRAAIERLFATGRYSDIQVDAKPYRDGVAITFITRNSWFIGDISVSGNVKSPPNRGQLENAGDLGLGQPYTDDKVEDGIGEMKRLLENNGLFVNEVVPVFDWETNKNVQQVNIRFEVEAARRARFTGPRLTGDLKADSRKLESEMGLRTWLFGNWKPMTQRRVRHAIDNVRRFYQRENRLEAKVALEGVHYLPELNRASLHLHIDAGPQIELRTIGAKVSRGTMKKLIPVFEEHSVDQDLLVEGARNLQNYFQTKGYFEAEVQFKTQNVVNDKATIDFLINRGDRHKLVYIEITGNRYFTTETIRERMFLQTAAFLQFRYGRFSSNLLKRDQDAIRNLYLSNGFRDVQVEGDVRDDFQGRQGNLAVFINIIEGPQYFVHDLVVEGINHLDKDKIVGMLSSAPGQPFSEFNIAVDRDAILARYNENGFPDVTFEWKPTPAADPHQVDLRFVVREGRQLFVRSVLIGGNSITRTSLIDRQITFGPGDPLSPNEMTDSQRRLYDLGVFAKVDSAIQNPDGLTRRKHVLYNVDEARRYSMAVGFGAELGRIGGSQTRFTSPTGTTGFSPRVSFDLTRNNLWGLGHSVSLRTRLSTFDKRALLTYNWPRFLSDDRLTAGITGFYAFSRDIRTFTSRRWEVSGQIVERVDKVWTLFYRFSYRHVSLSDVKISPFAIPQLAQNVRTGIPSFGFVRDRRDDAIDPHKGSYDTLDIGLSSSIFGSQVGFLRFLARNATYHPIGRQLVLARSTQFGNIYGFSFPSGAEGQVPLAERFFGGGGNSHRGFPLNQAGPRDLTTGFPLGGTTLFFNQTELRFPLIGSNIGGVLYHDMGNIYSSLSHFSLRVHQLNPTDFNYAVHGAGFGIRYRTPVGPVRFDIGYAFNPPSFFGFDPDASVDDLIAAGPNPCSPPAGVANKCSLQNVGHFRWFFSIGQTF